MYNWKVRGFFLWLTWGRLPLWLVTSILRWVAPTEGMGRTRSLFPRICSLQHVRNVPQNGTGASRHGFSWWVVCGVYPWCFLLKSYLFLSIRIDWNRFPIQKLAYSKFILFSAVVCIPHTVTENFLASQIFDWRFVKVNVLKWKQRWKLNIHAELERLYRPSISFLLFKYACDTVVLIIILL